MIHVIFHDNSSNPLKVHRSTVPQVHIFFMNTVAFSSAINPSPWLRSRGFSSRLTKCVKNSSKLTFQVTPQALSPSPGDAPFQLPDYDRDYFDELKAEYADNPNVKIFSKDDYTLNPINVPWLYENRGRDVSEIVKNVRQRIENASEGDPEEDLEEDLEDSDKPPPDALLWTDLHTEEEIASIRERALTADPVTGKVWSIPMTKDELDLAAEDEEIVRFRPDTGPSVFPKGDDDYVWGDEAPPIPPSMFPADPNIVASLEDSWDYMNSEKLDATLNPVAYSDQVPAPDPEEFRRWQDEAERRGGNSTVADSYALPPYRDTYAEQKKVHEATNDPNLPPQHDTLVSGHSGYWTGCIKIFSLDSSLDERFEPILKQTLSIQTNIFQDSEQLLNFDSTIQGDNELFASTVFSTPKYQNSPIRGRAVNGDASYVCSPLTETYANRTFSISSRVLKKLTESKTSNPVVEIGILRTVHSKPCRYRVILIANGPQPDLSSPDLKKGRKRFSHPQFSHVVFIEETKHEKHDEANEDKIEDNAINSEGHTLPAVPIGKIYGTWNGEALLFQPEYLLEGLRFVKTSIIMERSKGIKEADVSFIDGDSEPPPGAKRRQREPSQGKRKLSASVATARAHDHNRLSTCNVLCRDHTGDVSEDEVHAWKLFPSENKVSWLFSPRVGRFVDNYAGLVLTETLWLSFPLTKAHPLMWNVITLTEIASPMRRRVVVGRSREGILVGALFAKEREVEGEETDAVARYV